MHPHSILFQKNYQDFSSKQYIVDKVGLVAIILKKYPFYVSQNHFHTATAFRTKQIQYCHYCRYATIVLQQSRQQVNFITTPPYADKMTDTVCQLPISFEYVLICRHLLVLLLPNLRIDCSIAFYPSQLGVLLK